MNDFKKIAVISGGSGFLGKAVARECTAHGFTVIALEKKLNNSSRIPNVRYKRADITKEKEVQRVTEEIKKEYGEIFTIIHTASAPISRTPILSLLFPDFKNQFSVNVFGAFYLFKYFSEILNVNGSVIGITSSALFSKTAHSKNGSYVSAKFGLHGLLKSLSNEAPFRVYSIDPAFMPGGLNKDIPEPVRDLIIKKSPPEEITSPEEVADAILVLINDLERKWHGKTISIPGFLVNQL